MWFPPPSDSVSPQGYLPRDLYLLESHYGSETELRECIQTFATQNIKVVADIVINHRCAHKQVCFFASAAFGHCFFSMQFEYLLLLLEWALWLRVDQELVDLPVSFN